MLLDRGADVNTHDRLYGSALHAACIRGHSNVVQVLVDRGADIEGEHFESALQAACAGGHSNIVQILLDRGADIEGEHFKSALQAAITGGHFNIVQILVDRGADNNIQGGFYGSALHAACIRGHSDIVQLLVDRGADINIQGGFYGSALQAASDINIQGGFYGSSLQAACAGGHSNIVQILLDRGADIEGEHFESALQAASTIGHRKLAQLLQEWKNDVTAQGENHGSVGCTLQTSIFDSANRSGATHPSTMPTSQPKAKLDTQVVSSLASSEQKVGLGIDQDDTIPSNIKPKSDIEEDSVPDYCDAETTYSIGFALDHRPLLYVRAFADQLACDMKNISNVSNFSDISAQHLDHLLRIFSWKLHRESSTPFQWEAAVALHRERKYALVATNSKACSKITPFI
ncbi:hypothetical protein N7470_004687 [Penicillium chermesinum]|nr:hypothetical protein N7470_004687 [Penicillium chermesinum]